jgi:hypothetical protein
MNYRKAIPVLLSFPTALAAALLLVVIGVDGAVPPYEAKSPQPGQAQKQSSRRYADGPTPPLAPATCPSGGYDPTIPGCGAVHGTPSGPDYSGGNPNAGPPGPMRPPYGAPSTPTGPGSGPGTGSGRPLLPGLGPVSPTLPGDPQAGLPDILRGNQPYPNPHASPPPPPMIRDPGTGQLYFPPDPNYSDPNVGAPGYDSHGVVLPPVQPPPRTEPGLPPGFGQGGPNDPAKIGTPADPDWGKPGHTSNPWQ